MHPTFQAWSRPALFTAGIAALFFGVGRDLWAELPIGDSVGKGGKNKCADVRIVQYLLDQIPADKGGSADDLLSIDGKSGPKTEAAILKFQTKQGLTMDARVDVNGMTIKRLNALNPSGDFKVGRSGKTKTDGTAAMGPHPGDAIAWGNVVTAEFKAKVVLIATDLGASPSDLMAAMHFESAGSFAPDRSNAQSCAVGLIQFTSPTAVGLQTTSFKLIQMNAEDQLDFVKRYLMPFKDKIGTLPDLYMAILSPAFVGKPANTPVFTKTANPTEYEQNKGLDTNNDGTITKEEAAGKVKEDLETGLKTGNAG